MAGWLDAVTNPLSAATKTLQELVEVRDLVKFGDTFRKMHDEILAASANALAGYRRELELLDEIRSLKARMAEFEERKTQQERYELKPLGWGGYAYMLKPEARGTEAPHWVCTNCYANGKISIIQYGFKPKGATHMCYYCPSCNNELSCAPEALERGTQHPKWLDDDAA
jgi:hypothetical protein